MTLKNIRQKHVNTLHVVLHGTKETVRSLGYTLQRRHVLGEQLSTVIGTLFDLRVSCGVGIAAMRNEMLDNATRVSHIAVDESPYGQGADLVMRCDVEYVDMPWLPPLEALADKHKLKLCWYYEDTLRDTYIKHDPRGMFPETFVVVCDGEGVARFDTREEAKDYMLAAKARDTENMVPINHKYKHYRIYSK